MSDALTAQVEAELGVAVGEAVAAFGAQLARTPGVVAVLFYGSVLRTGDLSGVLDFYVLSDGAHRKGLRGLVERRLWPEISFAEHRAGDTVLRAKVATMPLAIFRKAASGELVDTTIWTRFVQPCALVWAASPECRINVTDAVRAAVMTAARFTLVMGPAKGTALDFWSALFAETYRAEFRVERAGREAQILAHEPERYARLLPLAWSAAGIAFTQQGAILTPEIAMSERQHLRAMWRRRRRWGRPLNIARLVKAAFTVKGAVRYAAWKIDRHAGSETALTPWQQRHPILAAPGLLMRLRRSRRKAERP